MFCDVHSEFFHSQYQWAGTFSPSSADMLVWKQENPVLHEFLNKLLRWHATSEQIWHCTQVWSTVWLTGHTFALEPINLFITSYGYMWVIFLLLSWTALYTYLVFLFHIAVCCISDKMLVMVMFVFVFILKLSDFVSWTVFHYNISDRFLWDIWLTSNWSRLFNTVQMFCANKPFLNILLPKSQPYFRVILSNSCLKIF